MQIHKRIISIVLACVLFFTGLPVQFMNFDGIPYAYAEGVTSTVDIRYDNFSNTESLKLNGDSLIKDNIIQFESGGNGESVFTSEKVALGENRSFSTAFSFRNISPATPMAETKGGFTFTLQSISNSETASDFHDENISPSLSIAFATDYVETGGTASLIEHTRNLNLATLADLNLAVLSDFIIAEGPMTRCEISAVPYINGAYDTSALKWQVDTYYAKEEPSDSYHVWIGYDGVEQLLHMLCLTPSGEYRYDNTYMELSEILSSNEVYAGFMGSFGNSGSVSEISSWYFKNDLSIFDKTIVDTDEVFLTNDMARLEAEPVDYFTLPMYGQFGSTISWQPSNPDVVDEDGTVKPPSIEDGPQVVRLTALVKKGSTVRQTREFELTIMVPGDLIVNADFAWLTDRVILRDENDSVDSVVSDLFLPTLGHYGSTIGWQSSNPHVVAENGWVNRPSYYTGDKEVTLTACIIRNSFEDVKEFNITVKAVGMEDEEMVEADQLWLTERQILNGNSSLDNVTNNLYLPATGKYGSTISWESDNVEIIATDGAYGTYGTVTRPSLAQGDQKVTLTATIKSNASYRKKSFIATVKVRDEDIVSADGSWLTDTLVLNGNKGLNHVVTDLNLPNKGENGSDISWTSSDESVVSAKGKVTRPSPGSDNEEVTLTITISMGDATPLIRSFTVTVRAFGLSDPEMVDVDYSWLTDNIIKNLNSSLNIVTSDLYLPKKGEMHDSHISWGSNDINVVDISGKVKRPSFNEGNKTVKLTATISIGYAIPREITFTVTVKALDQTHEEKVEADGEWLKPAVILGDENIDINNVTRDLSLPTVGVNGSNIRWESSNTVIIEVFYYKGIVTRPVSPQEDETVTLTATITSGDAPAVTKTFTLVVKARPKTDEEKLGEDYELLTDTIILKENSTLNNITGDVNLPANGENGCDISWSSTDTAFVNTDGRVKRPTYTQGDQTVTLTATISIGTEVSLTKTFELIIKALVQTSEEKDAEIVNDDYKWLVETIILNGNSTVKEITGDLNLPDVGENGSIISWQSNHPEVVDINGKVTRLIDGDKDVTLTATISKGSAKKVQWFYITVIKIYFTDEEIVAKDYEWLTEELVLNGNSSVDNVTRDLYLPASGVLGSYGSFIRWESSQPAYVALDGKIYRPTYFLGDMTVILTAIITRDSVSLTKTFTVIVKCAGMTDEQSVSEDAKWLFYNYNVLGGNPSKNSVVVHLSCPKLGPYGSTITWHSDNTDVISHEGMVTRPENGDGNKLVRVTATIAKGKEQSEVPYLCIVLQKPDLSAPMVTSTAPVNGSTDVLWNTNQITITYNEDIVLAQSHGILCEASETVQVRVSTDRKRLIITPVTVFSSGENKLLIPAGAVTDTAGNPADAYELKFTVEEMLVRNIEVIDSLPLNNQKGVDPNLMVMSFHFDDSTEIMKGPRFDYKVTLLSRDKIIPITYSLSRNKVTITLKETGESLAPGTIYRIIISEGLVQDRFYNKNKETIIEFMTEVQTPEEEVPEISSIYPADRQTGVSVRPNIEVLFSDEYEPDSYQFKLTDSLGKEYPLYPPHVLNFTDFSKTKLIFVPKEMLEPNRVYTLSGPYKTVTNPDSKEFSIQFTTSSGPRVTKTYPSTGDWDAPTRGIVEIYFDEPVTRGDNFKDMAFLDFANDPVEFAVEEAGNKVVLRAVSELDLYRPYSVYIPYGAFKNSKGVANTQYKITFYTSLDRIPYDLSPSYLDVSHIGFVRKSFKLSSDTFNMATWLNFVRMMGYGPVSYEWYIDDEPVGTSQICYYNFSNPGEYKVTFIAKDKYGYSYSISKTVEIQDLQDVRMTLKDSGMLRYIHLTETDTQPELKFELRLDQDDHFIYGERIGVKLYKDSILQPLSNYSDGGITITSNHNDNVYTYTYKPEYGDDSTYEVVFTYNGVNGEQVIREPFIVTSKEPATTNVFRFRLYENKLGRYYEELSYVHVVLNGEMLRANREMYTYDGSTFPVYTLGKTLQSNTYYDFKVENWNWDKGYGPFYLGKDTDNPAIFTGNPIPLASWEDMRITSVVTNHLESELNADNNDTYFEGLPTKLVFNVEGDWRDFGKGYYEIATLKTGAGVSRYGDTGFKIIHTQAHDGGSDIQKVTVQPGIQLESNSEQYWIRMVSPQGYKSSWEMCPHLWLMPRPSVLGKKLNISVIDGEYVVNWPTVFNGPIGGVIKALDGIPVLDGGSFGLGGGMPNFEGGVSTGTEIELSFHAKGGYGSSKKTKQPTQYKKVKKITIVSYEFNIELEGGVHLVYNWFSGEWGINNLYIMFDADVKKKWDKGFDFKIVEITAGVHVGAGIYGYIEVKNEEEDLDYRGIIRLYPNAGLYVDGSFGPYKVKGRLNAILPAEIHFPTGYIGVDFNVDASIKARTLTWSGTLYEEDLYKVHWDNGKEMVTRLATGSLMDETHISKDTEFKLITRDYLSRQSNWISGNSDISMMQSAHQLNGFDTLGANCETNPGISTIMENIYPEAEIALVENGNKQ